MRALKVVIVTCLTSCLLVLAVIGTVGAEAAGPGKPRPPKPTPTTDACGTQLKKADGSSWQCTLVDNFDGTTLNRNLWFVQTNTLTGEGANLSCHVDNPANVAVSGGSLRLTVRKVATPVPCAGQQAGYTAGQVSTFWKWSQQYGRFEARMKNTATMEPGLQEAFWLWPDARVPSDAYWPAAGEIDIVETYSQHPDLAIPFLHYTYYDNWGPQPGLNTAWDCVAQRGVWNTYALEWTATRLEILVNGRTCLVNTSGDPAFQKPYIIAFTQALGVSGNSYTGTAPLPATTEVDYVKVWR